MQVFVMYSTVFSVRKKRSFVNRLQCLFDIRRPPNRSDFSGAFLVPTVKSLATQNRVCSACYPKIIFRSLPPPLKCSSPRVIKTSSQRSPRNNISARMLNYIPLLHTSALHVQSPYLLQSPKLYLSSSLSLTEGQAETAWEYIFFLPMPPHVLMNFRGFPPGCGDSVADV